MLQPKIINTRGYGARQGVKMVVYGKAGMGKTTLCATCPNPIILSAESGLLALTRFDLPYIQINTLADLRDVYRWALNSTEARQFQTICIDSVTEIAEVFLSAVKVGKKDMRQAYGELIEGMVGVIREFRDLPGYNVYMSAKLERIKDEATGAVLAGPMMPGQKLGQAMPYFPDEVFMLDIEGLGPTSYRVLRTQPSFSYDAKDRSGLLNAIEEPHLGKIIAKIGAA